MVTVQNFSLITGYMGEIVWIQLNTLRIEEYLLPVLAYSTRDGSQFLGQREQSS
jgi:hypothetical protein